MMMTATDCDDDSDLIVMVKATDCDGDCDFLVTGRK